MYKVIIVGDGGVGKTSMVRRLTRNTFTEEYTPTFGLEASPVKFQTSQGEIILNIWDCAGQEKYIGLRDGYYIGAHAAMVVYSGQSEVDKWITSIRRITSDIPLIVVSSKSDLTGSTSELAVSAKTGDIMAPFLRLLRQLTGNLDLEIL